MPNWDYSTLTVVPPEGESVEPVFDSMKGEAGAIDFQKILPMPEGLAGTAARLNITDAVMLIVKQGLTVDEAVKELGLRAKASWRPGPWVDPFAALPIPILVPPFNLEEYCEELAPSVELGLSNYLKYGACDWYEWCCENWGTKWPARESKREGDKLYCTTAWAPPVPVFQAVSRAFPSYTFELCYAQEADCWEISYFMTLKAGEIVGEWKEEPEDAPRVEKLQAWPPHGFQLN